MRLTPTQARMLSLLRDGLPHTRQELHACLYDELAELTAIQFHISKLRDHLRPGQDVVCVTLNGEPHYRVVRFVYED